MKMSIALSLCVVLLTDVLAARAHAAERPRSESFIVSGVKIHFLVQGQGQPVVLIHGLHSSAQLNWNLPGVMSELGQDHLVVAIDLPGHGQSDKPADENAYG